MTKFAHLESAYANRSLLKFIEFTTMFKETVALDNDPTIYAHVKSGSIACYKAEAERLEGRVVDMWDVVFSELITRQPTV